MDVSAENTKEEYNNTKIILFDGECRLCNGMVDFVVRRDPKQHFKFASLQSDVAKQLLKEHGVIYDGSEPETIFLLEGGKHYTKSTAALRIAKKLSFPWPLLYAGIIIPPFIRNAIYDFIGKRRKQWFGVTTTCDTRTLEEEQTRFLDTA